MIIWSDYVVHFSYFEETLMLLHTGHEVVTSYQIPKDPIEQKGIIHYY